ncbi:pantetheine-phosphate adenylyltransferase [Corynebacterium poyangense]|uniref:Phosphopantetheine adenylyltransferase n=1 Tax=Corynebacterium poyangense TaxID=2684405 RepID=A0A7H0SNL1_9CORY|nr:pantetheine-phosphate adenylyltransferase [Corynebacterium poyangense]MBZ8177169.1 pantetheine-phosphate adenylyltransferase [Corynebacterium poyangense]QNQ90136.1 pantetheine-phosphate adenylyltransferase [Corynebacterium poyangense]
MKVVCPGSFDPITNGHLDIIQRCSEQFDEVVVLVTANPNKSSGLFSVAERVELIEKTVQELDNVTVEWWSQLLVDYTTAHQVDAIVKGLRSSLDYEYELPMAQMNRRLSGIDTLFFMTSPQWGYISSTLLKEVARFGGDIHHMVPSAVSEALSKKYRSS